MAALCLICEACNSAEGGAPGGPVKHYRVNKLDKHGGEIVKRKDVLANNDKQALIDAAANEDCPVCEVWHAGEKVGTID